MTTTATEPAVSTPHALAIELLRAEAQNLQRRQVRLDRVWLRAEAQPPRTRNAADVASADAAAGLNRDRHARILESIHTLERAQAKLAADQESRSKLLPAEAGEAIMGSFIVRPDELEIQSSEWLGHGQWNVTAKVTYAGIHTPVPRAFLLVRTSTGRLLVNP